MNPREIDEKGFRGSFLLYRKSHGGMRKIKGDRGGHPPRFRHQDRSSAVTEAGRLLEQHPEATFLILQEVGRVKLRGPSDQLLQAPEAPELSAKIAPENEVLRQQIAAVHGIADHG